MLSVLKVKGGKRLEGFFSVQGSKNGALPLMAAAVLHKGTTTLHNIPHILDVFYMIQILESLGCICLWEENTLIIDASTLKGTQLPKTFVGRMRSSVFLLGPLLSRCGEAATFLPGGCSIGGRPIDLHLTGLQKMQASIVEQDGEIKATAKRLVGSEIKLPFPSVGATENIVMAAVKAQGTTILYNAAQEPEITQLCLFLNRMGAKIKGIGSPVLHIEGVSALHDCEWWNQGDRIAAATYLTAVACCGGEMIVSGIEPQLLYGILSVLSLCGCEVLTGNTSICLRRVLPLKYVPYIRTAPFPGFPTDMQSPIMALLSNAKGTSIIEETIFEDRFHVVQELQKMGASIIIDGRKALVNGVPKLKGTSVKAEDLRGGAALMIAALASQGETTIQDCSHIQRGYEKPEQVLRKLGADIWLE